MFHFGKIKYFVKINNLVLVAVCNFNIVGKSITKIDGRTSIALIRLKNSGVFNQFFAEVIETKELNYIEISSFGSECILGYTKNANIYLISEFIIDIEHE